MTPDKEEARNGAVGKQETDPSATAATDDPSLTEPNGPVISDEELAQAREALDRDPAEGDRGGTDEPGSDETSGPDAPGGNNAPPPAVPGDGTAGDAEPEPDSEDGEGAQMSLLDHLGELRLRLTRSFIAIAVGTVACYGFAEQMFNILMQPMIEVFQQRMADKPMLPIGFYDDLRDALTKLLGEQGFQHTDKIDLFVDALQRSLVQMAQEGHFQYTYPAEAFFSYIKISIVAGLFLVSPYVFAQIWGFIAPGLYAHERKWMIPMAVISAAFFTSGALFGYFVVFPFGFEFFASFSTEGIQFTPKLNEYLSFCLKLLFAFGFVFELPLFIFFLARMGMVSSQGLRKKRKYAILIGFVLAAVLTPPDPFTQCLMAGPLIVLYEVGIWVAFFFGKNEKRHLERRAKAEEAARAEMDAAAANRQDKETADKEAGEPDKA
ncbi:twin-arginine translocase subunit TatC [Pseudodesulfovibrio sp. F-1]|uniref:Sec-independent protein translocase protein TatC n=1 Tax=Pseudodesulfovibrio alkaliphilus TaxID=2661613 RepID=A0A7K1KJS2_9BACT|nr:twin-arginine translocase subunit TatC [Pseudodesulfovibrio alkaliphilus]MUM76316.1 twin-arginine translocase subunit TatC [Pseudodesulfovibrio alkaliphilus]